MQGMAGFTRFVELMRTQPDIQDAPDAVDAGVAYVPGTYFYPFGGHHNTLRLNFSNSTPEQIDAGMEKLKTLFESKL